MAKNTAITAEKRTTLGRKVKQLRSDGLLPANIFGKKVASQAITVNLKDFQKAFAKTGETGLVDLSLTGESKVRPILISNVQTHPVSDLPIHVDFHQVDLTQKVTANVPVELIGESPAVKDKGAVLITLFDEIEVEALPTDLPDKFSIDISKILDFNDSVLAKDLKIDRKKIVVKIEDTEAVVMAQQPKEEEVEVDAPSTDESTEEAAPAEGDDAKSEETKSPDTDKDKQPENKQASKEDKKAPAKSQAPSSNKDKK